MSTNLEIEAKSLIDEKSYRKLVEGKTDKCYTQTNYYLDNKKSELHKKKLGLRVREKDGELELTLKVKQKEGKLEINQLISDKDFFNLKVKSIFPEGEVKIKLLEYEIDVNKLYVFTTLVTIRLDLEYKGCLISIDNSSFSGITDYEVECEADSMEKAKSTLIEFLKENEVPYQENFVSKLKRARDSL
ncbi:MAG: CYTH domain-containing protein [Bacilli bacterium]|nr:CYTH domain-containing protein [Bacilli bacterium]